MASFIGNTCPVCKEAFTETDDVVVCPECGTPHHRECYAVNGKCANFEAHSSGFIWKSPIEKAIHNYLVEEEREIEENEHQENDGDENPGSTGAAGNYREYFGGGSFNGGFINAGRMFGHDGKRTEEFEKTDIYGVSAREIACFQGGGINPFTIEKYRRIAAGHKYSLNLFAMLFFPFSMFYSRMRVAGIVFSVIDFLLRLPYTVYMFTAGTTFAADINDNILAEINGFLNIIFFAFRILSLLFYDYLYLRIMAYKIKHIRTRFILACGDTLTEEYYSSLGAAGKPSFLRMLLDSAAVTVALLTVTLLILNFFFK